MMKTSEMTHQGDFLVTGTLDDLGAPLTPTTVDFFNSSVSRKQIQID